MNTTEKITNSLNLFIIFVFSSILTLTSMDIYASDKAKEKRWAEQIADSLLDGEMVTLKAGDEEFSGIFTESVDGNNSKAVILMHGTGAHPDWPEVIHPLRVGLTERKWSTLSIQLPILANDARHEEYGPLFKDVAPRIQAATDYLLAQGAQTIVLVSHSLGAAMATHYLATVKNIHIKGIAAIGVSDMKMEPDVDVIKAISGIQLPYLDLYGSRDLDEVLRSAPARKKASLKANNKDYQQKSIEGADHFFAGHDETLVRTVYGWLKRHYGPKL